MYTSTMLHCPTHVRSYVPRIWDFFIAMNVVNSHLLCTIVTMKDKPSSTRKQTILIVTIYLL